MNMSAHTFLVARKLVALARQLVFVQAAYDPSFDIEDAFLHAEDFDPDIRSYDWETTRKVIPIADLWYYDDLSSWSGFQKNELVGLTQEELFSELEHFRGPKWATRALNWLKSGDIPPIVILVTPSYTGIADGRGRVSLALGVGLKEIPAIIMKAN